MIYTLTLNPSLDYTMKVDDLQPGMVNRCNGELLVAGGKGINVSAVLNNLGIDNICLGYTAGFVGDEIERLASKKCKTDFIKLEKGVSRINVVINSSSETQLNAQGPEVSRRDLDLLFQKLNKINRGDYLVLSGSAPRGINDRIYEIIMEKLSGGGINFIVDAEKSFLANTIKHRPFLIKPNHIEAGEISGMQIHNLSDAAACAKQFHDAGVQNVLISMGEKGAVLVCENGSTYASPAPKGKMVSSIGAGDSMIAGFLAGYLEKGVYQYAFKTAIAAGSASAFSEDFPVKEDIYRLMGELEYI